MKKKYFKKYISLILAISLLLPTKNIFASSPEEQSSKLLPTGVIQLPFGDNAYGGIAEKLIPIIGVLMATVTYGQQSFEEIVKVAMDLVKVPIDSIKSVLSPTVNSDGSVTFKVTYENFGSVMSGQLYLPNQGGIEVTQGENVTLSCINVNTAVCDPRYSIPFSSYNINVNGWSVGSNTSDNPLLPSGASIKRGSLVLKPLDSSAKVQVVAPDGSIFISNNANSSFYIQFSVPNESIDATRLQDWTQSFVRIKNGTLYKPNGKKESSYYMDSNYKLMQFPFRYDEKLSSPYNFSDILSLYNISIVESSSGNTLNSIYTKLPTLQSSAEKEVTIPKDVIEFSNPDITFNGSDYVTQDGTIANPNDFTIVLPDNITSSTSKPSYSDTLMGEIQDSLDAGMTLPDVMNPDLDIPTDKPIDPPIADTSSILGMLSSLFDLLASLPSMIAQALKSLLDWIISLLQAILDGVIALPGILISGVDALIQSVVGVLSSILDFVMGIPDAIALSLEWLLSALGDLLALVFAPILELVLSLVDFIKSLVIPTDTVINDFVNSIN